MASDCSSAHCSAQQGDVNQICKEEGWPIGHKVLVCDTSGHCCNCHCSCFVNGTLVAIPDNKFEAIENIQVKDKVLAAGVNLTWGEADVMFSNGTSDDSVSFLLEVSYQHGDTIEELLCTEDQPFLMPSRLLKRADKLTPGDCLVLFDGNSAEIIKIDHVTVQRGVHHISTGIVKPESLDGHLLNVQGVVAADYVVQLFQDELSSMFEKPLLRAARNADQVISRNKVKEVSLEDFVASGKQKEYSFWKNTLLKTSIKTPDTHSSFLTFDQSLQVRKFVPKYSYGDVNRISQIEYLFTIFKAFYPDVNFLSDWANEGGNAYVKVLHNEYYLVLQGGLARCKSISLEGLSIIISHELGHIYGGAPQQPDGFSCDTQSDFYGTHIILRKVWYEDLYPQMVFPGIDQIKELFSYLSDATKKVKGCVTPTLECRIETLMAGVTSGKLPPCAGGPCEGDLIVVGAEAKETGEVNIIFNEELDKESAEDKANYAFTPTVKVLSVKVIGTNNEEVRVIGEFEHETEYKVVVSNVTSKTGDKLDSELYSTQFKAL